MNSVSQICDAWTIADDANSQAFKISSVKVNILKAHFLHFKHAYDVVKAPYIFEHTQNDHCGFVILAIPIAKRGLQLVNLCHSITR